HGWLEVFGASAGDDLAHAGGAGEIDAADCGMRNHGLNDLSGVGGGVGDEVDNALGETGFDQGFNDKAVCGRADFRALEHHSVATCQWGGYCTNTQDDRSVPWRHSQHNTGWLAYTHGHAARNVGRNDFAMNLSRK